MSARSWSIWRRFIGWFIIYGKEMLCYSCKFVPQIRSSSKLLGYKYHIRLKSLWYSNLPPLPLGRLNNAPSRCWLVKGGHPYSDCHAWCQYHVKWGGGLSPWCYMCGKMIISQTLRLVFLPSYPFFFAFQALVRILVINHWIA